MAHIRTERLKSLTPRDKNAPRAREQFLIRQEQSQRSTELIRQQCRIDPDSLRIPLTPP